MIRDILRAIVPRKISKFVLMSAFGLLIALSQIGFAAAISATPTQLCTPDAFNGCWRDANNLSSSDNPVVIANKCSGSCTAQGIETVDQHTKFDGFEVYQIKFSAHSNLCIGVNNRDESIETRQCNAHGTAWARTSDERWINRGASEDNHYTSYACADEVNGYQIDICGSISTVTEFFTFQ